MSTSPTRAASAPQPRIEPSIGVAVGVVLVYTVLFLGVGVTSGIEYADWFDTAENAYRTAVLGLALGATFLVAFVAYARWDMLWRDPQRLRMTPLLWILVGVFVVLTLVRFAGVGYGEVSGSLIVAILVAGVLVGFAEELLFRGIFLRAMRAGARAEGQAALWTAVAFGLFHLSNILMGGGAGTLLQVFLAAGNGFALYTFRRLSGVIWVAMIAHGTWDISTFLDGQAGEGPAHQVSLLGTFAMAALGLVAALVIWRQDRDTAVTPQGIVAPGHVSAEPTAG